MFLLNFLCINNATEYEAIFYYILSNWWYNSPIHLSIHVLAKQGSQKEQACLLNVACIMMFYIQIPKSFLVSVILIIL